MLAASTGGLSDAQGWIPAVCTGALFPTREWTLAACTATLSLANSGHSSTHRTQVRTESHRETDGEGAD